MTCKCNFSQVRRTNIRKNYTHGFKSDKKMYYVWHGIIRRCYLPSHKDFKYYGGRGIRVCSEWLEAFGNFKKDMGEVKSGLTVDRINNNFGYCKHNCRWATRAEQSINRRIKSSSNFLNIYKTRNGFTVQYTVNKLFVYVGHFKDLNSAKMALGKSRREE